MRILSRSRGETIVQADSLLEVFQRIALSDPNELLRARATSWITLADRREFGPAPFQGAFERMVNIYETSSDPVVRALVVSGMREQRESARAIAFLREIVMAGPWDTRSQEAWQAAGMLAAMGPRGMAVLRQLHRDDSVRDALARQYIQWLASRGFQAPT